MCDKFCSLVCNQLMRRNVIDGHKTEVLVLYAHIRTELAFSQVPSITDVQVQQKIPQLNMVQKHEPKSSNSC